MRVYAYYNDSNKLKKAYTNIIHGCNRGCITSIYMKRKTNELQRFVFNMGVKHLNQKRYLPIMGQV